MVGREIVDFVLPTETHRSNSNHHATFRGSRNIVEVIFAFTYRATDVTGKFFVRVDVTEEFPFLVTKLSPYYDQ